MYLPVNLANVQVATGFDYPAGKYIFEITSSEVKANSNGNGQRLAVHNKIVMGPGASRQYEGRPLMNSYQLTDQGAPFLKRLFLCCGIDDNFIAQHGGQVDADWLNGRQYVASVVKNGTYTNISNEQPISEWSNQAAQSVPAQQNMGLAQQPSLLQPSAPPMMGGLPPAAQAPAMPPQQPMMGFAAPPPPPGKIG